MILLLLDDPISTKSQPGTNLIKRQTLRVRGLLELLSNLRVKGTVSSRINVEEVLDEEREELTRIGVWTIRNRLLDRGGDREVSIGLSFYARNQYLCLSLGVRVSEGKRRSAIRLRVDLKTGKERNQWYT